MRNSIMSVIYFIAFIVHGHIVSAAPLLIDNRCIGNALESCYLILDGEISSGDVERLEAVLEEGVEALHVVLNSKGGDLAAGMAIGRLIRENGFQTRIGIYRNNDLPAAGECLSACAYAFLGGNERYIREGSRIGFHRFSLGSGAFLEGEGGIIVGQKLSASIISYIVEMGVDARLFSAAAETSFQDMHYPDQNQRLEYDIETVYGFEHFFMEPYGKGVVAASRRRGSTHPYDRVDQLTVFCRNGMGYALLSINGEGQFVPDLTFADAEVMVTDLEDPNWDQWIGSNITMENVRTWSNERAAYIELKFDPRSVPITEDITKFHASLNAARASGGVHGATVELNSMDRDMLRSAFRLCI